jgi:hypothetical protein
MEGMVSSVYFNAAGQFADYDKMSVLIDKIKRRTRILKSAASHIFKRGQDFKLALQAIGQPQLSHAEKLPWEVWNWYIDLMMRVSSLRYRFMNQLDPDFQKWEIKIGRISPRLTNELITATNNAKPIQFGHYDYNQHYCMTDIPCAPEVNRDHTFMELSPEQLAVLRLALLELAKPIEACIGAPWRVVNVKCWKTEPLGQTFGMNSWHVDGFPEGIYKVMIYLTDVDAQSGTTEMLLGDGSSKIVEGPPGTWLFFKNSKLTHRGVAPLENRSTRVLVEITIIPFPVHNQTPFHAGGNARYPKYPWDAFRPTSALKFTGSVPLDDEQRLKARELEAPALTANMYK